MKNILLIILGAIALTAYAYTENQIKINITKNNKGQILLNITGHSAPIVVEMDGKSLTYNVGDTELNLDEAIDVEIDTASGSQETNTDYQIPPVMSAINPPLSTPY